MKTLTAPELPAHWSDYASGIAWGTVVLFAGIVLGYIGLIAAIYRESIALQSGTLIAATLIFLAFTVLHEAGHGNIAQGVTWMKPVERLIGWITTIPFLIPFGMFARIHDYHHAYTNNPDGDPDYLAASARGFGVILHALLIPVTYLYLTFTRFVKDPVIAQTHLSTALFYVSINIVFGVCIAQGYGQEILWLVVLPPLIASLFLGLMFSWIPHMPGGQQSRYQNTRTYLFPGVKYITLSQNYHHVHHLYPRIPWYNYERAFQLIRPEMEAHRAPIEELFSRTSPGLLQSPFASEPGEAGPQKLTLSVHSVHRETPDSVVITFANMNGKCLQFKAGQYVTITKRIEKESITRCYSICESPAAGKLSVGVKRVRNGVLSSYLNDVLQAGDELTVAGPFGDFIYESSDNRGPEESLVLIAGGSGITPVLSILQAALEGDTGTRVHLIYANRSVSDAMFQSRLDRLSAGYGDRLGITQVFEQPHPGWQGEVGRLNATNLSVCFKQIKTFQDSRFYICGPERMKNIAVETLGKHGVASSRISIEEFVQVAPQAQGPVHTVQITLANGTQHDLAVSENQTVLQVASQAGIPIPNACGVGQCGCCMLRVASGDYELRSADSPGLLANEKAQGMTLTCQCQPRSALVLTE